MRDDRHVALEIPSVWQHQSIGETGQREGAMLVTCTLARHRLRRPQSTRPEFEVDAEDELPPRLFRGIAMA